MAQDWAKAFYNSEAWRKVRAAYISSVYGLCEQCSRAGEIVHHTVKLTPCNVGDPAVSLNWAHLQLLCLECHNRAHGHASTAVGLVFTDDGTLVRV